MAKIQIDGSIVKQATLGNKEAIKAMFQTFMAEDETMIPDKDVSVFKTPKGLNEDIVREISKIKGIVFSMKF